MQAKSILVSFMWFGDNPVDWANQGIQCMALREHGRGV